MKIQTDIFGVTPKIGDTIVYNPPKYKGLVVAKCMGFTKSGLPELAFDDKYSYHGQRNGNGFYTPKTGFLIHKEDKTLEEKSIIKCSNWDYSGDIKFCFLSYIYLHGEAENMSGFDCCEGNMETIKNLLRNTIFSGTLLTKDNEELDVLIIPCHKEYRSSGLICLCTDHDSIRHTLFEYYDKFEVSSSMYEHEKEKIYSKYPEIMNIIHEYNRSK